MKLKNNIKQELISRINKNVSINNISKELNLAKSTIYYYYKKLKRRKYKKLNLKPGYSKKEGEIVGIFAGDGSQYFEPKNYSYEVYIHFGFKNKDYAIYVKNLFDEYFNKKFELKNEKFKTLRIKTKSKEIYNFFHYYLNFIPQSKHSSVRLKTLNLPNDFLVGFLKGFLDTDGCIYVNKWNKEVVIYSTTSKELASQIKRLVNRFGVKCGLYYSNRKHRNEKDLYSIQIWRKSTDKFLKLLEPFKQNRGQ